MYREDGKTLASVTDYDTNTGEKLKTTRYKEDGTVDLQHSIFRK